VCISEVRTAGEAYKIELAMVMEDFVEKESILPLRADGQDIVVLKASILDEDGNLVPFADNKVDFSIQGKGKIIGVGNGDIASHEANKAKYRKAYNGLCAVIVQSTLEAGEIIINATSPELKPGKFSIMSFSAN
jgi:beta-galactosidase